MRCIFASRLVAAAIVMSCLAIRTAHADDICEATALRDVPAIGVTNSFIRKGDKDTAITQFRVNVRTGLTSYCSHGGYCYPTHVKVGDDLMLALKMTNCKPSATAYERDRFEADEVIYGMDVIRSKIPPAAMRREDVKNGIYIPA